MNEKTTDHATAVANRLELRLMSASRMLDSGGYKEEVLDLYVRYRADRWRLLIEYLELMRIAGYPESEVILIQTL